MPLKKKTNAQTEIIKGILVENFADENKEKREGVKPLSVTKTASVHELPLQVRRALLLWPTWLVMAVRKPTLLFLTERGL